MFLILSNLFAISDDSKHFRFFLSHKNTYKSPPILSFFLNEGLPKVHFLVAIVAKTFSDLPVWKTLSILAIIYTPAQCTGQMTLLAFFSGH